MTKITLTKEQRDQIKEIFAIRRPEAVSKATRLIKPFVEVYGLMPVILFDIEKRIKAGFTLTDMHNQPLTIAGSPDLRILMDKPAELLESEIKEATDKAERELQQRIIDEVSAMAQRAAAEQAAKEAAEDAEKQAEAQRLAQDEDYQLRLAVESVFK